MDVFSVRSEATADASLAAIFERSRFGIAIAAMIKIIATTISNSINEKPFCLFFMNSLLETFLSIATDAATTLLQDRCHSLGPRLRLWHTQRIRHKFKELLG